jgi:CRP-like cAMP-binding protein
MPIEDDIKRLARVPMLMVLDGGALRLIASAAETRSLRAGDVIFRLGEVSDAGYVVLTGSVALVPNGDERNPAKIAGPGSLIGEIALISPSKRPVTAVAREATTVLQISRLLFHRVLQEYPANAARIRGLIAERLVAFTRELEAAPGWPAD